MARCAALVTFTVAVACPAFCLIAGAAISTAYAQSQTTEQLPLPTGSATTQSFDKRWELTVNGERRFFSSKTTRNSSFLLLNPGLPRLVSESQQTYAPFGIQLVGRPNDDWKLELLGRSAYAWSSQSGNGEGGIPFAGSYSGFTDSTFGGTVTYLGWAGIQPFASMNVNAPTGKTVLMRNQSVSKLDSDIGALGTFGEGWNFGPTIGINIPITKSLMVSGGVGYTSRGAFDREGPVIGMTQFLDRLNPGDVLTYNASLGYQADAWSFQAAASYSTETVTTLDSADNPPGSGNDFYKAGDRYFLSAGVGYAWNDSWSSKVTGSFSHFNKNKVRSESVFGIVYPLAVETFNSNSNVTTVNFDTTYKWGNFSVGPTAGYLYRDENGYNPNTFQFLPAKTKWSVGGVGEFSPNQQATLTVRVERLWLTENDNSAPKISPLTGISGFFGVPEITTTAWLFSVGGTIKF